MIDARSLRKTFGKVTAVEDVSFHAPDGRITGLLGPNGAGKSTTMRMLHGLMRPDSGTVKVDGIDVSTHAVDARRRVGVLPDALGLYPRLTAVENVRYYADLHGLSSAEANRRVTELVDMLDMHGIADRHTSGFSQGERMKVALARALVHRPQNVLLDEPTNGLDVMSTRAVRTLVRRLREDGRCVIFSSHIMQEVAALCDHIVVVAGGRVVAEGTADELVARTGAASLEDAFVALVIPGSGTPDLAGANR